MTNHEKSAYHKIARRLVMMIMIYAD